MAAPPKNRKFGFDYDHTSGRLLVTRVAPDSSLRCGDVIISLQGECIKYATTGYIDALITRRENAYLTLDVGIVRHRPETVDEAPAAPAPAAPATVHYITLQPKNRKFGFDYEHTSGGLVVTRVVLEGASANCGLRHGDVIHRRALSHGRAPTTDASRRQISHQRIQLFLQLRAHLFAAQRKRFQSSPLRHAHVGELVLCALRRDGDRLLRDGARGGCARCLPLRRGAHHPCRVWRPRRSRRLR